MNDQMLVLTPSSAELSKELGRKRTDLISNATFITFEPGLYSIDFRASNHGMSDVGLPLPCARLEPVVTPASPGRVFVLMTPNGGWLSRMTATAYALVVAGRAGAVLTVYRPSDGTPMPEVQFRSVVAVDPASGFHLQPAAPPTQRSSPGNNAMLMIHLEGSDRSNPSDDWVGDITGVHSIEGFSLSLPEGLATSDLEYQGIMGEDWRTPWFESGTFCGSRGLQLPLLGFCLRLVGEAANRFECRAHGQFLRGRVVGPIGSGEDCRSNNMPLTAMKVEIVAKQVAELLPEATTPSKKRPPRSLPKLHDRGAPPRRSQRRHLR